MGGDGERKRDEEEERKKERKRIKANSIQKKPKQSSARFKHQVARQLLSRAMC
jgi:hypothetical protein